MKKKCEQPRAEGSADEAGKARGGGQSPRSGWKQSK